MKTKFDTRSLVLLGLLTAVVFVFSFTPIGSIPVGPLVITLNVIPVAIGAIALGPVGGLIMGSVFGLFSFLQCFGIGITSSMGAILADINPFLAFVQRFVPRALDGFLAGCIFRSISKVKSLKAYYIITGIISGISYLLIAFVGISLVVSSIMIGIITYISVLERTREIGILRAIGASKHDVSTVFNAETLLVGLTAGLIGIGVSALLTIPINMIIHNLTSLDTLYAKLPAVGAVLLVVISMVLTLIAGLIPSRVAAKKDPVEALRTE